MEIPYTAATRLRISLGSNPSDQFVRRAHSPVADWAIDPTVRLVSVMASRPGELMKMRDKLRERDELGSDDGIFFLA